jgi:hypothetical protein
VNIAGNLISWATSFTIPYLFNPDQANIGGKIMLIFFGFMLVGFTFVFLRLPEMQGRTYEEMDELFALGISPRKFASTVLPPKEHHKKQMEDEEA